MRVLNNNFIEGHKIQNLHLYFGYNARKSETKVLINCSVKMNSRKKSSKNYIKSAVIKIRIYHT